MFNLLREAAMARTPGVVVYAGRMEYLRRKLQVRIARGVPYAGVSATFAASAAGDVTCWP